MKSALVPLAALALTACVSVDANVTGFSGCAIGEERQAVAEIYFGRNIGSSLGVSDENWRDFLDGVVSPRFPEGLTVSDVQGQWRDTETGAIVHEPSKVLTLILDDEASDRAAIAEIADAYKTRFQQQAVAVVVRPACVAFR